MKVSPRRPLVREFLDQKLKTEREEGASIYIKNADKKGNPLNFQLVGGGRATSGYWPVGLKKKPFTWILVYQRTANGGRVWVGDHVRTDLVNAKQHVFHLENVAGPLDVDESYEELVGKHAPQRPIYLGAAPGRETNTRTTPLSRNNTLVEDLRSIALSSVPPRSGYDVDQWVSARVGQGLFRERVLNRWNGACAVTGCVVLAAIRASHIKPWRVCSDVEKVDPCNGLPLVATLDALFDQGLISFSNDGAMLISASLDRSARELFGIPGNLRRPLSAEHRHFLEYHRLEVFQG